jgi:hypothetical protein
MRKASRRSGLDQRCFVASVISKVSRENVVLVSIKKCAEAVVHEPMDLVIPQ